MNPLQRDLDRIRLAGLERIAAITAAGLEALPRLSAVEATADRLRAGVDERTDPQSIRAMAVKEVVLEALDDLGPSADAAAIRTLFGAEPVLGVVDSPRGTDLQIREAAAAALVGRSWDTYRRRVRTEIIPRLAEAVMRVERRQLDTPAHTSPNGSPMLQMRQDHPNVAMLLEQAKEGVLVCGINLDSVVSCISTVLAIAKDGVQVRLLALDPRGRMLIPFSQFSGVDPEVRRNKIASNLKLLAGHIKPAPGKIELHVTDSFLSAGCIGVDLHLPPAFMIVQHYLRGTGADESPALRVERQLHRKWYDTYERQLESAWRSSNAFARSGEPAEGATARRRR
jgi:hypothetical protein